MRSFLTCRYESGLVTKWKLSPKWLSYHLVDQQRRLPWSSWGLRHLKPRPSRKQSVYLNRISGWLVGMLNLDKCWFSWSFSPSWLTYQQEHKTRSPTPVNSLLFLFTWIIKDVSPSPIQGIVVGYFGKGLFLKPMFVWLKTKSRGKGDSLANLKKAVS